jgi:biopolymer transport protein ExbD
MAEVSSEGGGGKPKSGKPKQKKSSTKIDMTPMVDLAFLLLTFFMLTTSFSKPKTMPIVLPEKPDKPETEIKINDKDVMHLILAPGDRLYYYIGITSPDVKQASYSPTSPMSIRKILEQEQAKNLARYGNDKKRYKFTVLIKPVDGSRYKNLVDIFDEMNIVSVRSYALTDVTPVELDLIKNLEAQAGAGGSKP